MISHYFLRPEWLLTLLPLLLCFPLWKILSQGHTVGGLLAPHLAARLVVQAHTHKAPLLLLCLCWALASLAAAGPTLGKQPLPTLQSNSVHLILLDASLQTRAQDIAPDRFRHLKYKAQDILNRAQGEQIALIAYSGDAFTITPLTNDPESALHMLAGVQPEIMPDPGLQPLQAFQEAEKVLQQAGYHQADITWLSAGILQQDMQDIYRFLTDKQRQGRFRVSVIAVGEEQSQPIRQADGQLLKDTFGQVIFATLNAPLLQRITQLTKGVYFQATTTHEDIEALQALRNQVPLSSLSDGIPSGKTADQAVDLGPYIALILLPLLLWLARRSALLMLFLLPFTLPSSPAWATATSVNLSWWKKPFYNQEQQAFHALQQQDYEHSLSLSQQTLLRGEAHYRLGNYQEAIQEFQQLDSAEAAYNTGNSHMQLHQYLEAIDAYQQALERHPQWQEALDNKKLAEELLQQEEEQQEADEQQNENDSNKQEEQNQEQQDSSSQQPNDANEDNHSDNHSDPTEQKDSQEHNESEEIDQPNNEQADSETQEPETQENQATPEGIRAQWDDLSDEEKKELEQLLQRLDADPSALLRQRLLREAKRRHATRRPL